MLSIDSVVLMYLSRRSSLTFAARAALHVSLVEAAAEALAAHTGEHLSGIQRFAIIVSAMIQHEYARLMDDLDTMMDGQVQIDRDAYAIPIVAETTTLPETVQGALSGFVLNELTFSISRFVFTQTFKMSERDVDDLEMVVAIDSLTDVALALVAFESHPAAVCADGRSYEELLIRYGATSSRILELFSNVYQLQLYGINEQIQSMFAGEPVDYSVAVMVSEEE